MSQYNQTLVTASLRRPSSAKFYRLSFCPLSTFILTVFHMKGQDHSSLLGSYEKIESIYNERSIFICQQKAVYKMCVLFKEGLIEMFPCYRWHRLAGVGRAPGLTVVGSRLLRKRPEDVVG